MKKPGPVTLLLWLVSCGPGEHREPPPAITVGTAQPRPAPATEPSAWKGCERQQGARGNRWWGWITACTKDARIAIEVDSTELGGPDLRFTVHTRACPSGKPARSGGVGSGFFARSFDRQLIEIRSMVAEALAQVDRQCGGPMDASLLDRRQFDRAFGELAERYWLNLPER